MLQKWVFFWHSATVFYKNNIIGFFININRVSPQRDRVKSYWHSSLFPEFPLPDTQRHQTNTTLTFPSDSMLTVGNYKTAPRASNQMSAVALRWDRINIRWCMCRCRARRPQQHPLRWHKLRSTLSHQQRTSSWINESFRRKWTLHTGKNKSFYAIDCGAQLNNLFIQLACPCSVSSTLNYILEVKFVIRLELTKSVPVRHGRPRFREPSRRFRGAVWTARRFQDWKTNNRSRRHSGKECLDAVVFWPSSTIPVSQQQVSALRFKWHHILYHALWLQLVSDTCTRIIMNQRP